jgi:Ran GTPase-activating protein (RanGAP) involved in mRNA processing and transport
LQQLRHLNLGYNPITPGALKHLLPSGLSGLTSLNLASPETKNFNGSESADILKALELPQLRSLDLSAWHLGDTGAEALAQNPHLCQLVRLELLQNDFTDKGVEFILESHHAAHAISRLVDPKIMPELRYISVSLDCLRTLGNQQIERLLEARPLLTGLRQI